MCYIGGFYIGNVYEIYLMGKFVYVALRIYIKKSSSGIIQANIAYSSD